MLQRQPRLRLSRRLGVLALVLAGCAPTIDQRGNLPDEAKLATIKPGETTKETVTQVLGTPSSVSTFNDKTWYYISRRTEQTAFFSPEVIDQQVVSVGFDDGGVVRDIERHGLADGRPIEPSPRVTPSAGRELGLFEQLIGNLGRFNGDGGASSGVRRSGPGRSPGT
jgi:outer membrane protein assembly factor BamE (lipoprotein component of BamABCDE complex)